MLYLAESKGNGVKYRYVSILSNHKDLFDREWVISHNDYFAETFLNLQEIEDFINWYLNYKIFRTQLLSSGDLYYYDSTNNVYCMVYSKSGYIVSSNTTVATTQPSHDVDDIDYDTPGEALKAHKSGKAVDWSKIAKKRF